MNKLKTLTGGHKASLRDYDHIQGAFADIFKGLGEMFFGLDMQKVIVSGIEFTINGTEYSHTAGVVFYNGEFFEVDALEAPLDSPGGKPKFAVTTGYPTDFPTIRFADGDDKSVHEIRKVALFPSTYAEGEDYDTFVGPDFWSAIQNENRRFVTALDLQKITKADSRFNTLYETEFNVDSVLVTLRVQKIGDFLGFAMEFYPKPSWFFQAGVGLVETLLFVLPPSHRPKKDNKYTYHYRPSTTLDVLVKKNGEVILLGVSTWPSALSLINFSTLIY